MGELFPNISVREMSIQVLGPKQSCAPALTLEKLVKKNLLRLSFSAGHSNYTRVSRDEETEDEVGSWGNDEGGQGVAAEDGEDE